MVDHPAPRTVNVLLRSTSKPGLYRTNLDWRHALQCLAVPLRAALRIRRRIDLAQAWRRIVFRTWQHCTVVLKGACTWPVVAATKRRKLP